MIYEKSVNLLTVRVGLFVQLGVRVESSAISGIG